MRLCNIIVDVITKDKDMKISKDVLEYLTG
jgi:hypothetical protein